MNVFMMARILNCIVPFIRKPIVWFVIVILGLGVWSWRQSSEIDSLQATNHAQAQAIVQLNNQLQAEQQAVIFQQKIANELKAKAEGKREKVRVIFKDSPCANTDLPSGVIEQLQ